MLNTNEINITIQRNAHWLPFLFNCLWAVFLKPLQNTKIVSPPRKLFVRGLPILLKINWKRKTQVLDDFSWQSIDQDQKVFAGRCRKFGEQKKIRLILKFVLGAPIRFSFSAGAYKGLLHCWIKVYKPSWTMWLQYQASATLNNFNQTKNHVCFKTNSMNFL